MNEKKKKITKEELTKDVKSGVSEFKAFIARGNVIDMAVGVIVGGAFGKIVTSLVNDILMPIIGIILGGLNFSNLSIKLGDATIAYGLFIQSVVDFLIIAFCIFIFVKFLEGLKHEKKKEEVPNKPVKSDEVKLIEEIRDLLSKKEN